MDRPELLVLEQNKSWYFLLFLNILFKQRFYSSGDAKVEYHRITRSLLKHPLE